MENNVVEFPTQETGTTMEIIKDESVVIEDFRTEVPINMTTIEFVTFRELVGGQFDIETSKTVSEVIKKKIDDHSEDRGMKDLIAKFGESSLLKFAIQTMKIGVTVDGDATCSVSVNVTVEDEHLLDNDIDITDKDAIRTYLDELEIDPDSDDGYQNNYMDSYMDVCGWENPEWRVIFKCRPICSDLPTESVDV